MSIPQPSIEIAPSGQLNAGVAGGVFLTGRDVDGLAPLRDEALVVIAEQLRRQRVTPAVAGAPRRLDRQFHRLPTSQW